MNLKYLMLRYHLINQLYQHFLKYLKYRLYLKWHLMLNFQQFRFLLKYLQYQ